MRLLPIFIFFILFGTIAHAKNSVTILAVGDILPAASASDVVRAKGVAHLFAATVGDISEADIAIGNLELPLTETDTAKEGKTYTFKGSPKLAQPLTDAGFDVFTLANNHIGDYGYQGILDTIETVEATGVKTIGAGVDRQAARAPAFIDRNGVRIAFLGYSNTLPKSFWAGKNRPGTAYGNPVHIKQDVEKAKAEADIVVISFHWGAERMTTPKEYQVEFARIAIDAGASIVLGHHPHVLQGVEYYKGGMIFYSLGNFAFGSYSKNARTSMMARIVVTGDGEVLSEILPLNVFNTEVFFQPRPLAGEGLDSFLEEYQQLLDPFGLSMQESMGGWYLLEGVDQSRRVR